MSGTTQTTAPFRLMLAGQSLIERPLSRSASAETLRELISGADLAITNLEVAIETPNGWPVRDSTTHAAPESVLDALTWFGFRAVALASNHAFDLGPPGILAALDAAHRRALIAAGTGCDATSAAMPGVGVVRSRRVALLGIVAAPNPPGAHARDAEQGLPARPGVNRLRVDDWIGVSEPERELLDRLDERRANAMDVGTPRTPLLTAQLDGYHAQGARRLANEGDVAALLRACRTAAREADIVVVYLHNHYWASPQEATPSWVRMLAHRCIDEGATVFLGHGTPVLQGVEFYRGHLLAYGLGSFVFHTHKAASYPTAAWETAIVDLHLASDGRAERVRFHPLIHGRHPERGMLRADDDGAPLLAGPVSMHHIVARVARLSAAFGTRVRVGDDGAVTLQPDDVSAAGRR
jgi:poly-gamma-glutamate synthesis protein (capsule biosynthesis protein)